MKRSILKIQIYWKSSSNRIAAGYGDHVVAGSGIQHRLVDFFIGIHSTLMTTYQALGKSVEATILTFGRQLLVYFPLLYVLNALFGFKGFILALPVTDVFTAIIALGLSGSFLKMMRKNP